MRKTLAVALLALAPAVASAQNWMFRVRAIDIVPDVSSSISGIDVSDEWVPEVDFTYFFTPNLAVELILATARHEVTLNGQSVGKLNHLPPTLTLQYHFDLGNFKPYVGAGLNYTWFYNIDLTSPLGVKNSSWGGALQAGIDYKVGSNVYLNFDVKKIWIGTDVEANGQKIGDLDIDPWVIGLGVGWRF